MKATLFQLFSYSFCLIMLSGCVSGGRQYSESDYPEVNVFCNEQASANKKAMHPHWFTQWLSCQRERVMPMDICAYPSKQDEIVKMYDRLFVLAPEVDSGSVHIDVANEEMERMMIEMGIVRGYVGKDRAKEPFNAVNVDCYKEHSEAKANFWILDKNN